ncbi:MAG: hypothetical protein P8018_11890 [Acidobacteriota bacterium]|jgi:cation:H+ antiporter
MKSAVGAGVAGKAGVWHSIWTSPAIIAGALMIAWAAESAQFFISQGLSLAILAWVQTLPEFAVEAVIAWEAPHRVNGMHLVSANFTGAVRLLIGLGWPMIYAVAAYFHRRKYGRPLKVIVLEREHSVEVMSLVLPVLYFIVVIWKGTLSLYDTAILFVMYALYMVVLNRIPPKDVEDEDEVEWPIRRIVVMRPVLRNLTISLLFLGGAGILYVAAAPFLHSLLTVAVSLGISEYVFVQWVAPLLSEFPEKVSAFYWARKVKAAPMALMNMVSSNINQWTMLAGMIPIVFAISAGHVHAIPLDYEQRIEIALTVSQSILGFCLLANMAFAWHEAALLFGLWLAQFVVPGIRLEVTAVYLLWSMLVALRWAFGRRPPEAAQAFWKLFQERFLEETPG